MVLRIERRPTGLHIALVRRRPGWRFVAPAWIAFIVGAGLVDMLVGDPSGENGESWFLVVWVAFGSALLGLSLWGLL